MKSKIKILMTAAEVAPYAKVGGLGDVTGSLPPALEKLGCDVRIVMPKYGSIDAKKFKLKKIIKNFKVQSGKKEFIINIWLGKLPNSRTKVYFVENEEYFGRDEVYYGNNAERFLFFSLAVMNILPEIKFIPDIIHCHDFHTALIPDLIKANPGKWGNIKTLYTIHNLNYQGKSETEILSTGNLEKNSLASLTKDAKDGDINFMVQGIINADLVNTVSKTYAKEISTSTYGAGLEKVIKANKNKISGIVNGIDVNFFNPKKDKFIKYKFSTLSLYKKYKNKLYLEKKLGWQPAKNIPIVGLITRLAWQKGLELIDENLVSSLDCRFVFLGTGDKQHENRLLKLARRYPDKVSANILFNIELAQEIYAGSDMFLMPSRFEPCGLGQMIAMRYGTVPIVRATGGLEDTVDSQVGFKFKKYDSDILKQTIKKALKIYGTEPKKWNQLVKNCMRKDFSWNKSAQEYIKIYKKIVK